MKLKHLFAFVSASVLCTTASSQEWVTKMQEPQGNFYDVKADFDSYWSTRDKTEKGKGYKAFMRWQNFVEKRVYPSGNLALLSQTAKNFESFLQQNKQPTPGKNIGGGSLIASSTWTPVGPMGPVSGSAGGQLLKSGRLNFITVDPNNTSKLWVGAPAGGLWSSTNGGSSWTTNTDYLSVIGCSDLAIDPTNSNVMYLATGDGDAGDTRSIGLLKSTNGGATWAATGLSNNVSNNFLIRRVIINPNNTQILLVATNTGIYRTANGGTSWTQVTTNSTFDLEFKPGNPNVVYSSGTSFRWSTNGGVTFTVNSTGITTTSVNRMAIAVTPNDSNYVYVLASASSNSGLFAFYKSVNGGTSFAQMTTTVNLLGYSSLGNDTGGQGWYDLCIAASPLDKNEVVTGGVNVWRTTNGGTSWSIYSHWTGSGAPFSHADHHDLQYDQNGQLYGVNDGTVYKRTSTNWTEISGTMNISQIYKIGMSSLLQNKWITGHQDNGSVIYNGTTFNAALGGDGMDCFIDRTSDNNMFAEYYNGALRRSTNGGSTWSAVTAGLSGTAPWVTAWKQDPQVANTIYCGYSQLFKSINQGTNWVQLTATGGTGVINEFAIAPSNNQVIYVLRNSGIYKTIDGGVTWANITGTVPVGSAAPQFVTIDPGDPNNAWVVLSGYSAGNKVFITINGGVSWINYSANLPNIPGNCLAYQPGTNDCVYVGMDVGIYYRTNTSSNWILYNTNLPNVPISDLEISPATPSLIHAATFGRGVWVASTVAGLFPPASNFNTPASGVCSGVPVTFTDQTLNQPTTWSWSVNPPAGIIMTSSVSQNATITFPTGGNYTVTMFTSNSNGAGTVVSKTIAVSSSPPLNIALTSLTVCGGAPATLSASGAFSYTWSHGGGNGSSATFFPSSLTVYTVTGTSGTCSISRTATITPSPVPAISISGPTAICEGESATLLAGGGQTYTWNTSSTSQFITVTPSVSANYSVLSTNQGGCVGGAMILLAVNPPPIITIQANATAICVNEQLVLTASGALTYTWLPGGASGASFALYPTVSTVYTVQGIDVNGCKNNSFLPVGVDACTRIKDADGQNNFYSVFPNPVRDQLIIAFSGKSGQGERFEILDVVGKVVLSGPLHFNPQGNTSADLSGIAPGMYIFRVVLNNRNSEGIKLIRE